MFLTKTRYFIKRKFLLDNIIIPAHHSHAVAKVQSTKLATIDSNGNSFYIKSNYSFTTAMNYSVMSIAIFHGGLKNAL